MMSYKGYSGVADLDFDTGMIHGRVVGLRDVITFQGETVAEAARAFRDSVDDYLEFCASRNEPPEKPFSGRFLVRIAPALHRELVAQAAARGVSLNALVESTLSTAFPGRPAESRSAPRPQAARPARKKAKAAAGTEVGPAPRRTKAG
jgi:predicted HicB family RNase H-like nuclease